MASPGISHGLLMRISPTAARLFWRWVLRQTRSGAALQAMLRLRCPLPCNLERGDRERCDRRQPVCWSGAVRTPLHGPRLGSFYSVLSARIGSVDAARLAGTI